jgi:hypothetical protein
MPTKDLTIEQQIIEATSFEAPRKYKERQDYLAALAKAVNKLEDKEFDTLSNEAVDWFNDACRAISNKKDIPEFADAEETTEVEEAAPVAEAKVEKKAKAEPKRRAKGVPARTLDHPEINPQASIDNFEVDGYGIVKGSKNAAAVAMFEQGCRMSDVTASIGGTYYNLVARLMKQGHTVEKGPNGVITITHKDK